MENTNETKRYGKRSIWSLVSIYLAAAIVVYSGAFLIYREAKDNGADDNGTMTTQAASLY